MEDTTAPLTLDHHLGVMLEAIFTASLKWYNLGLRLGLQVFVLDAIKIRCNNDPAECLREMLREWLKQGSPPPTWEELVDALTSTAVGEGVLGQKLKAKYCRKRHVAQAANDSTAFTTVNGASTNDKRLSGEATPNGHFPNDHTASNHQQFSPDTAHRSLEYSGSQEYSGSHSDQHSSDSSKEQKTRRAFGCGCGRCSLTTFLDKGCPEPVKSLSSFPYLQTQGLNHTEVMILKGRLYNEFQLMTRRFSKFNFSICMSLIYQEVPVKMLARVLRDLRAFQPSECDSPLLRDRFDAIKAAEDIDDVFDILAEYVSFFSFHITEHIVENLGTKDDKKLLAEYKAELEEYCKRNIFECPSYSTPKLGVANLVMKVEGIEKYNLKHLAELISHVSKVLSVSQHTLQLCSVEKGCVQLNFQTPHFVKESIFPLTAEQREAFAQRAIILVMCEGWTYKLSAARTPANLVPATLTHNTRSGGSHKHGAISRSESERRLRAVSYDCFLLRESESLPGRLTLSVKQKGELNHVLIECTDVGLVPKGEMEPFQNMTSFVSHINSYLPPCPRPQDDERTASDQDLTLQNEYAQPFAFASTRSGSIFSETSDFSEDTTGGDWTGGTGDSGVVLSRTPPIPPKHTGPRYEKIEAGKRDRAHDYEPRYVSVKIKSPAAETPPPLPIKKRSSQHQAEDKSYENIVPSSPLNRILQH